MTLALAPILYHESIDAAAEREGRAIARFTELTGTHVASSSNLCRKRLMHAAGAEKIGFFQLSRPGKASRPKRRSRQPFRKRLSRHDLRRFVPDERARSPYPTCDSAAACLKS